MYFNRKLLIFNVDTTFRKMFYSCFIESVLLLTPVKVCSKIAGTQLSSLNDLYKVRSLRRARSIMAEQPIPCTLSFPCCHQGTDTSCHFAK